LANGPIGVGWYPDRLAAAAAWNSRRNSCIHCGATFPGADIATLKQHQRECQAHPLFAANQRIAELESALSRVPVAGEAVAPDAWMIPSPNVTTDPDTAAEWLSEGWEVTPLYAAPPSPPVASDDDERALLEVIGERDATEEIADDLAAALGDLLGVDIGEHSSSTCPWRTALDAYEDRPTPPADDARDAARMTEAEYKALHFNNPWPAIYATAKRAYEASTANDPTVHCNRFPAWSELSSAAQQKWVDAAMSADQAKGDANV
jgi:hypothetical protein